MIGSTLVAILVLIGYAVLISWSFAEIFINFKDGDYVTSAIFAFGFLLLAGIGLMAIGT